LQELAAGIVALLPGFLKADHGIDAQRDAVLAAVVAVLQALGFAAGGGDDEVKAAAVAEAGGLAGSGLGRAHGGVVDLGHGAWGEVGIGAF
jgi:hypothetical protein